MSFASITTSSTFLELCASLCIVLVQFYYDGKLNIIFPFVRGKCYAVSIGEKYLLVFLVMSLGTVSGKQKVFVIPDATIQLFCRLGCWQADYPLQRWGKKLIEKIRAQSARPYQIIVADAADAVSVNFSGRCKFLQI